MTSIPQSVRERLASDPFMRKCVHVYLQSPTQCEGRIEWEHAMYYKGAKIQEAWAIVPTCYRHHRGGFLNKEFGVMFALLRADDKTLGRYSKAEDLTHKREHLVRKYSKLLIPGTIEKVTKV